MIRLSEVSLLISKSGLNPRKFLAKLPISALPSKNTQPYYSPGQHRGSKNNVPFFLKVPLGSDKNVPYIGFTSPTRFNKKFSKLNYNYKHFTISS